MLIGYRFRYLIGTGGQKMWYHADQLYTNATSLASAAKGNTADSDDALKQKAGTDQEKDKDGTLRGLARELHSHANTLSSGVNDTGAAQRLATAVGDNEGTQSKLRNAIAQLHGAGPDDLTSKAQSVKQKYQEVKSLFQAVKNQAGLGAYSGDKEPKYQEVVKAWKAFDKVYNADLRNLAETLRDAVGDSDSAGLQQALTDLNGARDPDLKDLITKAKAVIKHYGEVDKAYNAVKAQEQAYTNASASTQYTQVESQFNELQTKFNEANIVHATGIKNNSTQIQTKSSQLSSTAESKSTSELTTTKNNDIQGNTKGSGLQNKARQLKEKASDLYRAAESLRAAANAPQSPLEPLKQLAQSLKTAAKGASGLFGAAQALATHRDGEGGLELKANNVITRFELVKQAYDALMEKASEDQKKNSLVTDVKTKFEALKADYDSMLNLTKLEKKAKDLTGALSGPAGTLAQAVKTLRDNAEPDNNYANAQNVITQYENVETAYNSLTETASVKDKFEALKTVYNSILNFAKIKYYSTQLATAAEQLSNSGVNPEEVITYFNAVAAAYNQLGETEQKHVQSEFENLQEEYS